MKEHTLWTEKYRSKTLETYITTDEIRELVEKYISNNDIQNLIFYGPPGTGKTTLAKLISINLNCDYLYINASDERGIDTIRDKVQGFASVASFKPLKIVILDEADYLTTQAQASLRNIIETYSKSTRFILTCNYIERILDPLQSRCHAIKVIPPTKVQVAEHLVKVLELENISYDLEDLKIIINQFYPDIRKILNSSQIFSKSENKLSIPQGKLVSNFYLEKVLDELKKNSKDSWKNIRQIIADYEVSDFEELFHFLYEKVEEYSKGNNALIIIKIEEYIYHSNFRIDKEINAMGLICQILEIIK